MNLEQQLIFLFSALGAINGFFVSGYFLFLRKEKHLSDYFLGALLLMLSIRIIKSVFLFFNPNLFEFFIQFGLSACILIGPFLLLYVRSMVQEEHSLRKNWWWHIVPFITLITVFGTFYPYYDFRYEWSIFIELIYKQWLVYVLISGFYLRDVLKKLWQDRKNLQSEEIWLLTIFFGVSLIWLAYDTSSYTSYIVGALSFSFVFYLSVLLWFYQKNQKKVALDIPIKYAKSNLREEDIQTQMKRLTDLVQKEKVFLDPDLSLAKLSARLGITSKELSQVINQSTQKNYSRYIANLRVEEAKRMLLSSDYEHYKIAAIAFECGFNSISSFNAAFKKITGQTAKSFRKKDAQIMK